MQVQHTLEQLATAQIVAGGAPLADVPGTLHNLHVAHALGQLAQEHWGDDDRCTGYVAYVRLTPEQLLLVAQHDVRLFQIEDNTPGAPVLFLMEQLNLAGRPALQRRMRALSALPGVEVLAGWRGTRLRCHRVSKHGLQ